MRPRLVALLLAFLALTPSVSAWSAEVSSPVDAALSARSSLLVAGHLVATAEGARFGAPQVQRADFGDDAIVCVRSDYPDPNALPSPPRDTTDPTDCSDGERHRAARVRVLVGGLLVTPDPSDIITFDVAAGVGALGGANLTLDGVRIGPGLFAGGASTLTAEGTTFTLRPLGEKASVEVRGMDGFKLYNGTEYTFTLTNAEGAFLEAPGGFVQLGRDDTVRVNRASMQTAERGISVDAFHRLALSIVAPDQVDRRADLVAAFGPFQVVPALLNGAVSQAQNLTLGTQFHETPLVFQVEDASFTFANNTWLGHANGTATIQDGRVSKDIDAPRGPPLLIPILLGIVAIAARAFTDRATPQRRGRMLGWVAWGLCALILVLSAANAAARLLGANPFLDFPALSNRSRVQLMLLAVGVAATAGGLVGVSLASLVRSLLSRLGRKSAVIIPPAAGALAAFIFIWISAAPLVTLVAKFVRL